MPFEDLPAARLFYEFHGEEGDPTVLVHGMLGDHRVWHRVAPGLSRSLRVLAYDRRGHGSSTGEPRAHPVRDDATDLALLLEASNVFPVHLVCHSYGGAVALRLAADRPELVRSVLVHEPPFVGALRDDPATAPEGEYLLDSLHAIAGRVRSGDPDGATRAVVGTFNLEADAFERMAPDARAAAVASAPRWAEELEDPAALGPDLATLSELPVPVLLSYGEESPGFAHRVADAVGRVMRNAEILPLPQAGHAPHVAQPDRFVAIVQGFLVERHVPVT